MAKDPRDEYGRNPAFWLAETLVRIREDAGRPGSPVPRRKVSEILDVDPSTLQRLERGRKVKGEDRAHFTFPPGFERNLIGYAKVARIKDPREILQRAVDLWIREGSPPSLDLPTPAEASEDDLPADPLLEDKTQPNRQAADRAPKRQAKRRRPT